jgi:hypothetical protein
MEHLWRYFLAHWAIPLASWVLGTTTGGVFVWFYPNRKEWREEREGSKEKRIDSRVLKAIGDYGLWKGARTMTGAGIPGVRAYEIAEQLDVELEEVANSLSRLELRGMVSMGDGNMNDPRPRWFHVPR